MTGTLRPEIFDDIDSLPSCWDIPARNNIFLSRKYLRALHRSAPANMQLHYLLVYRGEEPVAVAISQFLDMSRLKSFGERDNRLKTAIRTFVFRRFASNVLILGNNMLTGQNAFAIVKGEDPKEVVLAFAIAIRQLTSKFTAMGRKPHLTIWKDFAHTEMHAFEQKGFTSYYPFSTQPNMVLNIPSKWKNEADYVAALHKKYRDQYKRARKKASGLLKRRMELDEIGVRRERINELYHNVAANAPFNTFYLHEDHFYALKRELGEHFLVYGYFDGDRLVGFNTIIRNGRDIDTYFLGYDEVAQRECMLYLNMLYDMLGYSVKNGYDRIIFARTALEIKSSVGAEPEIMYGLIRHSNRLINSQIHRLFGYFEPDVPWTKRHPFKQEEARQPSSAAEESQFQAG